MVEARCIIDCGEGGVPVLEESMDAYLPGIEGIGKDGSYETGSEECKFAV
jgi:hypothetical protein